MTPEEYWRVSIFTPYLDHIISELNSRFSVLNQQAIKGFLLLPSKASVISVKELERDLLLAFAGDLPSPDTLARELDRWQRR